MEIQVTEKGLYFFELISGSHGHMRTRIYVSKSLLEGNGIKGVEKLSFPVQAAKIESTPKGTMVLRPVPGSTAYLVEIHSGYRGGSNIKEIRGGSIVASGGRYHSGQGALGMTAWALVNATSPIEVIGERTGRRVDQKEVAFRIHPDGHKDEINEDGLEEML